MTANRDSRRGFAPLMRPVGRLRLVALAVCGIAVTAGGGLALAQALSEQQIRCMQLQQELAAVQGGGGAGREELGRVEQQIAQADRVFQGTQAAMEDAGCFESFFIFGRALVRSPKCLKMNDRVESARRQLTQLQQQRQAITGGGGNKRRKAELSDALARSGCSGAQRRPSGGLLDFFGGEEQPEEPQTPVYRSVDPNGRYRSVCVRLCDGFYYPVSYSTYGARIGEDAQRCQANCAAPAELYVYRNPGQEIEQAISLQGSAYMDLPVALKYRKEYVKGCSCKQAEYNPTEIEAANKRAEADPATGATKGAAPTKPPAPQAAVPAGDEPAPQLELDITGSNEPAAAPPAPAPLPAPPPLPAPAAEAQEPPAPPVAATPPPPPPAEASVETTTPGESTVAKKSRPVRLPGGSR